MSLKKSNPITSHRLTTDTNPTLDLARVPTNNTPGLRVANNRSAVFRCVLTDAYRIRRATLEIIANNNPPRTDVRLYHLIEFAAV